MHSALIMEGFDIYCGEEVVETKEKGGVWTEEDLPLYSVICHVLHHMVVSICVHPPHPMVSS